MMREQGVYSCADGTRSGLSLSNAEAARLRARSDERRLSVELHPRTFLLESRRRVAVVLDWHLAHASCPFYADFRCTVYDERPLVCRAYPVMIGSPLALAPDCPKMPVAGTQLREELKVRRALDRAHAMLDADGWRALESGRFAKGLAVAEADRRVRRYRHVALEEFLRVAEQASPRKTPRA